MDLCFSFFDTSLGSMVVMGTPVKSLIITNPAAPPLSSRADDTNDEDDEDVGRDANTTRVLTERLPALNFL